MTPERWALVDRLLELSLPLRPEDREACLRSHCHSDAELYREVQSLLDAHDKATNFLEKPAIEVEAQAMAASTARFAVGELIGPYRVVCGLGTGGMSDVYRAYDATLERDVAIKVLTRDFADNRERLQRARLEAKAASALNHPNIVTIYEIGESEGTPFIVSEYIDGRTLRDSMRNGLMPFSTVLDVAVQVASALCAAHNAGIVHGDIKPENVMIRPDGLVKVLDFGLVMSPERRIGSDANHRATAGTPPYMSPEQSAGDSVDARADLFSLGVMLYEMIAGRLPRDDARATHAVAALGTRRSLQRIIARMLAVDRDERYSGADQVHADLSQLRDRLGRRQLRLLTVGALVALGAVTTAIVGTRLASWAPSSPVRIAKLTPITSNNRAIAGALSPEGTRIAYVTQEVDGAAVRLRELNTGRDVVITPRSATEYVSLAFSRDSRLLYYVARDAPNPTYTLYRTSPPGENGTTIASSFISDVAFSPDGGRIAFVRARPPGEYVLTVANVDGGHERPLLARRMGRDTIGQHLSWSPDGRRIVITAGDASHPPYATLIAVDVSDGTATPIPVRPGQLFRSVAWTSDGGGIIVSALDRELGSGYQLWHIAYPDGTQSRITNDLQSYQEISLAVDSSAFVTLQDSAEASVWTARRQDGFAGTPIGAPSGSDDGQHGLAWSPSGRLIYTSTNGNATHLWVMDADGTNRRPLTSGKGRSLSPTVSHDGRYVVFVSNRSGAFAIWRLSLDKGDVKFLTTANATSRPRVSPDGKWVIYHQMTTTEGPPRLWKVSIDGGSAHPLTEGHAQFPAFSPDGTKVAYSFVAPSGTRPARKIAIIAFDSGASIATLDLPTLHVQWTPDGNALTFVRNERGASNVWVQPLDGGTAAPVTAFQSDQIHQFDWSRDGRLALSRGATGRDVVMISGFR